MVQERALLWNRVASCVPPEDHVGVRRARTGSDGHRERFMITGICYGCAPVGAAWSVGVLLVGAGPVRLVEHRPRHPEAAHSWSLDGAAGITRPIESASTLMPPGMLRGPNAAPHGLQDARGSASTCIRNVRRPRLTSKQTSADD
jgi:hypothetical protein